VVINSGTQGHISFNISADNLIEGQESVVIELSDDINRGAKSIHTVTISEENISPSVALSVHQADNERMIVNQQDGLIVVKASVSHPDETSQYSYQWSNSEQLLSDADALDSSFSFDEKDLTLGIYHLAVTVTSIDDTTLSSSETISIVVQNEPVNLGASDSDNDGIPDNIEGLGDSDSDGIPDYLDNIVQCNVVPSSLVSSQHFLLEGAPGVCLRLGDSALQDTSGGARISDNVLEDNVVTNIGGIFDFVAYGLPVTGQTYQIVIPQLKPIPANAIYRKTTVDGQWSDFVEDTDNQLLSAVGEQGYCPPPGDDKWTTGLIEGSWCISLVISDGGPNDGDGQANNTIVDPGGVAVVLTSNNQPIAMNDSVQTPINTSVTIDALINDSDSDDDVLQISSANAVLGMISIVNNQLYYQPSNDYFGDDTIVYGISDGQGGSSFATITVTILANQAPVAKPDTASVKSGQTLMINVLNNDTDPNNDALSVLLASASHGTVVINADNTLSYTSTSDFSGVDTINYQIEDIYGATSAAKVTVTVTPIALTLKNSGGGAIVWLLFFGLALISYRVLRNAVKGNR